VKNFTKFFLKLVLTNCGKGGIIGGSLAAALQPGDPKFHYTTPARICQAFFQKIFYFFRIPKREKGSSLIIWSALSLKFEKWKWDVRISPYIIIIAKIFWRSKKNFQKFFRKKC